jgi:hypothetical protein
VQAAVVDHLPLYSARYISRIFRVELTTEKKIQRIWDEIMKDYGWISSAEKMGLKPILVGHGLYCLCYGPPEKECYLVLADGDWDGDLRYERPNILDCLLRHDFNKETNEVTFKNSNIILNIGAQIAARDCITAPPRKLFSKRVVSSATLVWGETALRKISRHDVTGARQKVTLDSVSRNCFFELSDKNWRWDQLFQDPSTLHDPFTRHSPFTRYPNPAKRRIT